MAMALRITKITDGVDIAEQVEPRMRKFGNAVAARAQRIVPKRTFRLHDSISAETKRSGAVVTSVISATAPYALFVELGTSRMRAQPYLRPALAQSRSGDLNYGGTGAMTRGAKQERRRGMAAQRRSDRAESAED